MIIFLSSHFYSIKQEKREITHLFYFYFFSVSPLTNTTSNSLSLPNTPYITNVITLKSDPNITKLPPPPQLVSPPLTAVDNRVVPLFSSCYNRKYRCFSLRQWSSPPCSSTVFSIANRNGTRSCILYQCVFCVFAQYGFSSLTEVFSALTRLSFLYCDFDFVLV